MVLWFIIVWCIYVKFEIEKFEFVVIKIDFLREEEDYFEEEDYVRNYVLEVFVNVIVG